MPAQARARTGNLFKPAYQNVHGRGSLARIRTHVQPAWPADPRPVLHLYLCYSLFEVLSLSDLRDEFFLFIIIFFLMWVNCVQICNVQLFKFYPFSKVDGKMKCQRKITIVSYIFSIVGCMFFIER